MVCMSEGGGRKAGWGEDETTDDGGDKEAGRVSDRRGSRKVMEGEGMEGLGGILLYIV